MRLVVVHARALTLELLRYPSYLVPTLVLPGAFFLVFAVPHSGGLATAEMARFAGFAAIGVAFFQFGVGIAVERASPWEAYVRTLPVGAGTRLTARVVSAALFAAAAAAALVAVALATTAAHLDVRGWSELAVVLLLGTAPFALLGIALGYLAPPRGALPLANLLYLGLSYAGGLWIAARDLPAPVRAISPYLPTRALADALAGATAGDAFRPGLWLRLAGFAALFAALAAWAYRRDEGKRFH